MKEQTYIIEIEGPTPADSNKCAEELRDKLLGTSSEISVERRKGDPNTQDFGATLVLVLGTPVAVELAKAFRDWINRDKGRRISIKTPEGEVLLENIGAKDAYKILDMLKARE